jgi:O-antigen/teichoic acid export membrane protein
MAAAYLTGPLLSALFLGVVVNRSICALRVRWNPARFMGLLAGSRHFAAQQLLFAGSAQAEGVISPRLLGMQQFGCFTAGSMLGSRFGVLPDSLCAAAYPGLVRAWSRGRRDWARAVHAYLAVALVGGLAVAFAGWAAAGPLGRLLLPGHAADFASVARITIWMVPLLGVELVMGYALNAAGRDALQAKLAVPAAIIGLAASAGLVWGFGLIGASWSMVLRPVIRGAFLAPHVWRMFREEEGAAPLARIDPLRRAG